MAIDLPPPNNSDNSENENPPDSETDPPLAVRDAGTVDGPSAETGDAWKETEITPELLEKDKSAKIEKIRAWAEFNDLKEGDDFLIIKNIGQIEKDDRKIAPHEQRSFFVGVREDRYADFKKFIGGQYFEERKRENPNEWGSEPRFENSWGGRFAVLSDGPSVCDTVPLADVKTMTVATRHGEFKDFYKQRTGFDFPTSDILNPKLSQISERALDSYKEALERLRKMKIKGTLSRGGDDLFNEVSRAVLILEDARNGQALIDLPETFSGGMPSRVRHYADMTYNAEHIRDLDDLEAVTGIKIPDDARIDRVHRSVGLDKLKIDEICGDFSEYLAANRDLAKAKNLKERE